MDKIILFPSVALGMVFMAIYLFRCHKGYCKYNLSVMVTSFIGASGIVVGLLLFSSFLFESIKVLKGIDIYIVIAGMAVTSVSVQGVHREIFKKKEEN